MSFEKDLEKTAARYHDTIVRGWEGLYAALIEAQFERIMPYFVGDRVLEMGCGDGEMTQFLTNHFPKVTVVDGSETMIAESKKRLQGRDIAYVMSMFETYEPAERFDTVIMSHIVEHLDEPVEVLRKVSNWLSDTARVIVTVPNAGSLHRRAAVKMGLLERCDSLNPQDLLLGHRRVYSPELLREHCEEAGYRIIHFGGIMLKPLANRDIEKHWTREMIDGFIALGDDFPELSSEIFVVLERA